VSGEGGEALKKIRSSFIPGGINFCRKGQSMIKPKSRAATRRSDPLPKIAQKEGEASKHAGKQAYAVPKHSAGSTGGQDTSLGAEEVKKGAWPKKRH